MQLYPRDMWVNNYPEDKMASNCPFCDADNEYEIFKTPYWRIMHNKFPILGMSEHIMAAPLRHVILAKDLTADEFANYKEVEIFVHNFYETRNLPYFTFMRESLEGRSIEHLHYHFVPGKIYYENIEFMLLDQGFTDQLSEK